MIADRLSLNYGRFMALTSADLTTAKKKDPGRGVACKRLA